MSVQTVAEAARLPRYRGARSSGHDDIGTVRGVGFMRAIEFVTNGKSRKPDADRAQQVVERAREGSLLVIRCGVHRNIVRLLAPIVISDEEFDEAMRILREAFASDAVAAAA